MSKSPRAALLLLVCPLSACLDTSLPDLPGAGSLSGTVTVAVPGVARPRPAVGAVVEVLGTSLRTAVEDTDGRFVLDGLRRSEGTLFISLDADGDGLADAQRFLPLAPLRVGAGRHVALGEVVLGRNARLVGQVRVRATAGQPSGHGGITVFIKGTAFLTFSADDGSFALGELPEGRLEVVFFRAGLEPLSVPVDLSSGEERRLADVELEPAAASAAAVVRGQVVAPDGAPLDAVQVRALGAASFQAATGPDGAWGSGEVAVGVYNIAFEREGSLPVLVEGVLLVAGEQVMEPVVMEAGQAGALVLVAPAGFDAGLPVSGLDCRGACAAGFSCSARVECETSSCGLQSCAGPCNDGRCYATECGGVACAPGDVCDGARCVALACAGVSCPQYSACAAGRCVSTLCTRGPCPVNQVCVSAACVELRCVDVACGPGASCVGGSCLPTASLGGPCAPGSVFVGGRCVDQRCQGVVCAAGAFCRAGECTASGLIAAGRLFPEGRTNLAAETVIVGSGPDGWRRLNFTTLPRVIQLGLSRDGQWLFAVTDDVAGGAEEGTLWRSSDDGLTWLQSWIGDPSSGMVGRLATDHQTGTLLAAINGGSANLSAGVIASDDDGASWRLQWQAPAGPLRERVTGVSPSHAVAPNSNNSLNGLFPLDGGPRIIGPGIGGWGSPAHLLFDPLGLRPSYLAQDQLRAFDGGLLGPMRVACANCALWATPPSTRVHLAAPNAIWSSADGESGWGVRALPQVAGLALSGLAQGSSGALYASNEGGLPPLLVSVDDGVTWSETASEWSLDLALSDPYPAWQPDASYGFQQRVRPTTPNGLAYERVAGPNVSGFVEPAWPTDGGSAREPNGLVWNTLGRVSGLRLEALVSRACDVGQQRCGASCVDISADPLHCGACGRSCSGGTCRLGQCLGTDAGGTQPGCADGTREGFIDDLAWPDLAACAGAWPGDLTDPGANALCGAGFHVCEPADLELSVLRYADAVAFPGCFAYRASNDGFDGCEPLECQGSPDRDDVAGLGRTCLRLSGVTHGPASIPDGGRSCLGDGTRIDTQCCASSVLVPGSTRPAGCRQRGETGVVCCRD